MTNKQVLFGSAVKSTVNPWDVDNERGWQLMTTGPTSPIDVLFGRVPWFRRGVKDRALNVSSLPWAIYRAGVEAANSQDWSDNKPADLEWMDNPRKLFAQLEQSLSITARAYIALECNPSGYIKRAVYVAPNTITEIYDQATGKLIGYDRVVNGKVMHCDPASAKYRNGVLRIVAIYDADYLTEEGHPANSSDGLAALTAAGVLHSTDRFVEAFFSRGAIKASILGVEGGTQAEVDRLQSWWDDVIAGVKNAWSALVMRGKLAAPIVIGEGIEGLENDSLTTSRRQDIATALGVPESRMWSAAANYATRVEDEKAYFRGTIIPEFDLIAEALNSQVFTANHRLDGWRIQSQPETMDVFQADEANRAGSLSQLVSSGVPLVLAMQILGYDLTDEQWAMLEEEEEAAPVEMAPLAPVEDQPAQISEPAPIIEEMSDIEEPAALSVDTLKELQIWQRKAIKAYKATGSAVVDFHAEHIPAGVYSRINDGLKIADTIETIKWVFENVPATDAPAPIVQDDPWLDAAERLSAALESLKAVEVKAEPVQPVQVVINNLTPQAAAPTVNNIIPEQAPPVVNNIIEQPAPVVNVTTPDVTVNVPEQPAPVVNVTTAPPAPAQSARVIRDSGGKITRMEAE